MAKRTTVKKTETCPACDGSGCGPCCACGDEYAECCCEPGDADFPECDQCDGIGVIEVAE